MEVANIIVVKSTAEMDALDEANIAGKKLCRPSGYRTDDLDADDRNWLANGVITLTQPFNTTECFNQLLNDAVDAVVINEFNARSTIKSLDIGDQVKILDSSPLPSVTLHAVVHRDHPEAGQLLGTLDASIDAIRQSGLYNEVLGQQKP